MLLLMEDIKAKFPFRRLILVSNREPYILKKTEKGVRYEMTTGGLVSALDPVLKILNGIWIAWAGEGAKDKPIKVRIPDKYTLRYVKLTEKEISRYYYGFANAGLWPLCHCFTGKCDFERLHWQDYVKVNQKFAEAVLEELSEGDLVWINDYQLALLPGFIREKSPQSKIVFFWHIPFPSFDIFRILPWRGEILTGLLGSDLIGFHFSDYTNSFLNCVRKIIGCEVDAKNKIARLNGRYVHARSFPVGIDFDKINDIASRKETITRTNRIRRSIGTEFMILGVDRLDYTKGIIERLLAIERLLTHSPDLRGKFTFVQIAAPSRTKVKEYRELKRKIDETVGRINGRFTQMGLIPIRYFYRSFPFEQLISYYRATDVALITPLRDGMNLVAKEYVAARTEENGVLILSEFAGVAAELKESLLVNPFNIDAVCDKIRESLEMSHLEKNRRMKALRNRVRKNSIHKWLQSILTYEGLK